LEEELGFPNKEEESFDGCDPPQGIDVEVEGPKVDCTPNEEVDDGVPNKEAPSLSVFVAVEGVPKIGGCVDVVVGVFVLDAKGVVESGCIPKDIGVDGVVVVVVVFVTAPKDGEADEPKKEVGFEFF